MTTTKLSYLEIANAHMSAKLAGKFDDPVIHSKDELYAALAEGKTFSKLYEEVEFRFCTISSIMGTTMLGHMSSAYKANIRKGFRIALA